MNAQHLKTGETISWHAAAAVAAAGVAGVAAVAAATIAVAAVEAAAVVAAVGTAGDRSGSVSVHEQQLACWPQRIGSDDLWRTACAGMTGTESVRFVPRLFHMQACRGVCILQLVRFAVNIRMRLHTHTHVGVYIQRAGRQAGRHLHTI